MPLVVTMLYRPEPTSKGMKLYANNQQLTARLFQKNILASTGDQRLAGAQVTFRLGDFQIGELRDIVNRKAVEMIAPPNGEMLAASTPCYGYGSDGNGAGFSWCSVQPRWQPASVTSSEALNATLGQLHEVEWRGQGVGRCDNGVHQSRQRSRSRRAIRPRLRSSA